MQISYRNLAAGIPLLLALVACGNSGSSGTTERGNQDASLSNLEVAGVSLDQVFQSNQRDYTGSAGFLHSAINITATANDPGATINIDGVIVDSGAESPLSRSMRASTKLLS